MSGRTVLTADSIVEQAIAIIRTDGHEGLSMRALASHMGVTAPAFYDHFPSREDLLRACAHLGYVLLADRFETDAPSAAIDRAWHASRSYVGFALEEPELFRLMFLFRPGSIEAPSDNELAVATTVFDAMVENLARAITDGSLQAADPMSYGIALWAAVHGVATVAILVPDLDPEDLTDAVVGPMLRGWAPD